MNNLTNSIIKKIFMFLFLFCFLSFNSFTTEKEIDEFNRKLSERDTKELSEKIAVLLLGSGAKNTEQNRELYIVPNTDNEEDIESDECDRSLRAICYCCWLCWGI